MSCAAKGPLRSAVVRRATLGSTALTLAKRNAKGKQKRNSNRRRYSSNTISASTHLRRRLFSNACGRTLGAGQRRRSMRARCPWGCRGVNVCHGLGHPLIKVFVCVVVRGFGHLRHAHDCKRCQPGEPRPRKTKLEPQRRPATERQYGGKQTKARENGEFQNGRESQGAEGLHQSQNKRTERGECSSLLPLLLQLPRQQFSHASIHPFLRAQHHRQNILRQ